MQGDVSFIPAVSCGLNAGSTDLPLPAYLAFILYQHCLRKAFGKYLTQKSAAQLVQTGGSPGAQHGEVELPFPRAFGHSDTLTGGISKTALLSLEYLCSWMSFPAVMRKVLPLKLLQPLQDSSFPLGMTTGHDTNSLGKTLHVLGIMYLLL